MLYWDDACWFIMGSLMFAAAFVKTGVDKRVCLMMFRKLAVPNVQWITLVFFIIIAPLAVVHLRPCPGGHVPAHRHPAVPEQPDAAKCREDPELAKMLMITIAMACNIGGFGAPSGGARNVIMMTYLNDMFGMDIGYFQWVSYAMPFVIRHDPDHLVCDQLALQAQNHIPWPRPWTSCKSEIGKMGGWSRQQIIALIIFVVMVFGWFTEKIFYDMGIYPSPSGHRRHRRCRCRGLSAGRRGQLARLPGEGGLGRGLALCGRHHLRQEPWMKPARPIGWPAPASIFWPRWV